MLSFFHFHVEQNWIRKVISSSFQLVHIWAAQVWIMLLWFSEAVIIIWVEASDAKQWANCLMLHIILSLTEQCLQYTRGLSNANNYVMLCSCILRNNSFQTWHFDSLIKKKHLLYNAIFPAGYNYGNAIPVYRYIMNMYHFEAIHCRHYN